tara:strand:+ start:353 stop:508 length:156 start_codon:yes stop_codon:yes gene_type:complete
LNRYIVNIKGHKKVFAKSFDEAKKKVDSDLKYIHPNFNMGFESITEIQEEE